MFTFKFREVGYVKSTCFDDAQKGSGLIDRTLIRSLDM